MRTKKPFVIGKNYRYNNYALGEKVREVIRQYADGSLSTEKERDLRQGLSLIYISNRKNW